MKKKFFLVVAVAMFLGVLGSTANAVSDESLMLAETNSAAVEPSQTLAKGAHGAGRDMDCTLTRRGPNRARAGDALVLTEDAVILFESKARRTGRRGHDRHTAKFATVLRASENGTLVVKKIGRARMDHHNGRYKKGMHGSYWIKFEGIRGAWSPSHFEKTSC